MLKNMLNHMPSANIEVIIAIIAQETNNLTLCL